MSDLEAIAAHRQALERTIEVRKARLKTQKNRLKSELHARLTPKGIVLRFPITTVVVAFGIGWVAGRATRALITLQSPYTSSQATPRRSMISPLMQTLKEIALQTLTNVVLNKTREFLVSRMNRSCAQRDDFPHISKSSRAMS
jgi:hypothetical protein